MVRCLGHSSWIWGMLVNFHQANPETVDRMLTSEADRERRGPHRQPYRDLLGAPGRSSMINWSSSKAHLLGRLDTPHQMCFGLDVQLLLIQIKKSHIGLATIRCHLDIGEALSRKAFLDRIISDGEEILEGEVTVEAVNAHRCEANRLLVSQFGLAVPDASLRFTFLPPRNQLKRIIDSLKRYKEKPNDITIDPNKTPMPPGWVYNTRLGDVVIYWRGVYVAFPFGQCFHRLSDYISTHRKRVIVHVALFLFLVGVAVSAGYILYLLGVS